MSLLKIVITCALSQGVAVSAAPCTTSPCVPKRSPEYEIDAQFINRQSKYALQRTLSQPEMKKHLMSLFEAAHWAPSNHNSQPWVFVYAVHGTPGWDMLFNLISPKNQLWVKNAGALIVALSNTLYEKKNKPLLTHSFETGMAVAYLLLQASNNGLIGHPMETYDEERTCKELKVRADYAIEAFIAIGEPAMNADCDLLEFFKRDEQISTRKKIAEFVFDSMLPDVLQQKIEEAY